jgi:hypothetical protein
MFSSVLEQSRLLDCVNFPNRNLSRYRYRNILIRHSTYERLFIYIYVDFSFILTICNNICTYTCIYASIRVYAHLPLVGSLVSETKLPLRSLLNDLSSLEP